MDAPRRVSCHRVARVRRAWILIVAFGVVVDRAASEGRCAEVDGTGDSVVAHLGDEVDASGLLTGRGVPRHPLAFSGFADLDRPAGVGVFAEHVVADCLNQTGSCRGIAIVDGAVGGSDWQV